MVIFVKRICLNFLLFSCNLTSCHLVISCCCFLDLDECDSSLARCHSNAICKNTAPGYCCECTNGYYGNGVDCVKEGKKVDNWMGSTQPEDTVKSQFHKLQRTYRLFSPKLSKPFRIWKPILFSEWLPKEVAFLSIVSEQLNLTLINFKDRLFFALNCTASWYKLKFKTALGSEIVLESLRKLWYFIIAPS